MGAQRSQAPEEGNAQVVDTLTLDHGGAARSARHVVAGRCAEVEAGSDCTHAAVLMTSELVTNAVLHGDGDVQLGVDAGPVRLRVEVADASPSRPRLPRPDDQSEGGRGLVIVDALAADWGVQDVPGGKVVWFEIATQP